MTSYLHIGVILFIIVWFCFVVGPPAILIWAIRRWWQTSPRIGDPAWRSYTAIGAIFLVSLSELLWIVSAIWIGARGGGSYDPVFQWIVGLGFFAAPTGLLAGFLGKGTLRWPACSLSIFALLSWLVLGLADS
jgi:hypothetical protein